MGLHSPLLVHVAAEHLEMLSSRLRVRVEIDASGWLRSGAELCFGRTPERLLRPLRVRVGTRAVVHDLLQLGDMRARCVRYNEAVVGLHFLRCQLADNAEHARLDDPGGCQDRRASLRDLMRLHETLGRRQARCMGHGIVRVETLDLETAALWSWRATLAAEVARLTHEQSQRRRSVLRERLDRRSYPELTC